MEYNHTKCTEVQKRNGWQAAATKDGVVCKSEAQERHRELPGGSFPGWKSKHTPVYESTKCIQHDKRMRWALPVTAHDCVGQQQNRSRENNGDWDCWDGSSVFESCKQTQSRVRFKEQSATKCESEVQTRERDGTSAWPNKGAWTGDFKYDKCVMPGEQVVEQTRYKRTAVKNPNGFKCTPELQRRSRNNGGKWTGWACKNIHGEKVTCQASSLQGEDETCVETRVKQIFVSVNNMCALTLSVQWRKANKQMDAAWPQPKKIGC